MSITKSERQALSNGLIPPLKKAKAKKEEVVIDITPQEQSVRALAVRANAVPALIRITGADSLVEVRKQQSTLFVLSKEIKAKKEGITKPLNQALKATRDLFRPLEERVEKELEARVDAVRDYDNETRRRLDSMRERLSDRVEEEEITQAQAGSRVARAAERMGVANIPGRTRKVVVIDDESKIPRGYFDLSMPRLNQAVLRDGITVPGCHIEEQRDIVNR